MATAADMRDMAGTPDKIAASMTRGYAAKTGKPERRLQQLLAVRDPGLMPKDALEAGLATAAWQEPVR